MLRSKKTMMYLVAAILVLTTVLAGCSGNNSGGNTPPATTAPPASTDNGGKKDETADDGKWELGEPLEFTMYSHYDGSDFPVWESTPAGKWLSENKGVKIKMIAASGAADQKLASMISSDDLPDVIWADRTQPMMEKLIEEGKIVAFDDYLDKYPNLKTWMGDNLNMLRSDDGKLYKFPNWYTGNPNGNAGYVINKKIYEELGSPKLETTDDLYKYLVKVKETYKDIIPFEPHRAIDSQGLGVLYTAFGEGLDAQYTYLHQSVRSVPKGDKLTSLYTDPVFRESTKYIAKLFREKLIDQDAFTHTQDMVKEKVLNGRVAVFAGASPTDYASEAHNNMVKEDPNSGYFMIWPIHKEGLDKNKIYPGTYTTLGWNTSYITTGAENPDAIFGFLDWLTGPEGQNLIFFGPEGGYWDGFDADGWPNFTDKYDQEAVTKIELDNVPITINGNTGYINPAKMKYQTQVPLEEQDWLARYQSTITWKTQFDVTQFINLDPPTDSDLGVIKTKLDDLHLQVYANVMTNSKSDEDVDKILDKAEADAQKIGYDKLLEFRTEKWLANVEKINSQK